MGLAELQCIIGFYKYSVMTKKQVKQVVEAKSDTQKIKALEERI